MPPPASAPLASPSAASSGSQPGPCGHPVPSNDRAALERAAQRTAARPPPHPTAQHGDPARQRLPRPPPFRWPGQHPRAGGHCCGAELDHPPIPSLGCCRGRPRDRMGYGPATPVPCNTPACPGDPRAHPAALSLLSLQRCGAKQGRERQQATGCPLPVQGPPKSWPRRTSSPIDTDSSVPQEGTWRGRTQHLPGTGRRAAGSGQRGRGQPESSLSSAGQHPGGRGAPKGHGAEPTRHSPCLGSGPALLLAPGPGGGQAPRGPGRKGCLRGGAGAGARRVVRAIKSRAPGSRLKRCSDPEGHDSGAGWPPPASGLIPRWDPTAHAQSCCMAGGGQTPPRSPGNHHQAADAIPRWSNPVS